MSSNGLSFQDKLGEDLVLETLSKANTVPLDAECAGLWH